MKYTKKHQNLIAKLFKKVGGSHGRIGDAFRQLGESAYDVPLRKRRKLMLEMLEYKTRHKPAKRDKGAKRAVRGH